MMAEGGTLQTNMYNVRASQGFLHNLRSKRKEKYSDDPTRIFIFVTMNHESVKAKIFKLCTKQLPPIFCMLIGGYCLFHILNTLL